MSRVFAAICVTPLMLAILTALPAENKPAFGAIPAKKKLSNAKNAKLNFLLKAHGLLYWLTSMRKTPLKSLTV